MGLDRFLLICPSEAAGGNQGQRNRRYRSKRLNVGASALGFNGSTFTTTMAGFVENQNAPATAMKIAAASAVKLFTPGSCTKCA
jgi:hypothetical protein